ncbi:MAG TPA: prepilin-type N-terminal cleavage/methylation domain-containing protein [Deltaproteobacteria bacterium]|nr:prepilin-type N-terminal cleavage/methylation domain-containing protein [Deltaproteobacteria bacterium]
MVQMVKKAVRVRIPISATGLLRNNKTRGFTLIELLVVILILGLFSSLLAVRIEDVVTGGDLRLASRIVIAQIQKLRGMAGLTHKVQVLGVQVG